MDTKEQKRKEGLRLALPPRAFKFLNEGLLFVSCLGPHWMRCRCQLSANFLLTQHAHRTTEFSQDSLDEMQHT